MSWKEKKHPERDVSFIDIRLVGHSKVRATMFYDTEHGDTVTTHEQPIEFSLCEAKYLGSELANVTDKLQKLLDEFKAVMRR